MNALINVGSKEKVLVVFYNVKLILKNVWDLIKTIYDSLKYHVMYKLLSCLLFFNIIFK